MIYDHDRMKIDDDTLVSIDVEMYDAQGNLLEKSDEPLTYLHGHGDIFSRIEEELSGKEAGADVSVHIEPEEAFGDYDPELVTLVRVEDLGEGVEVGMRVDGAGVGAICRRVHDHRHRGRYGGAGCEPSARGVRAAIRDQGG